MRNHTTGRPFNTASTYDYFRQREAELVHEIESLENDYVLKASASELEDYFLSKYRLEPLTLDSDGHYMDEPRSVDMAVHSDFEFGFPGARQRSAKGTQLSISVPYTGSRDLWHLQPSTFTMHPYPELNVGDTEVTFYSTFRDDQANPQQIKQQIDSNIRMLIEAVAQIRNDVMGHNRSVENSVRTVLAQKIAKAKTANGAISALGIPMKPRDRPMTYVAPDVRRKPPVSRPAAATAKFAPEPTLEQKEYEHILSVIRSMSLVIERNPNAFASLDEEAIRTHFLLQLNGHYDGTATGETFNAAGKTDILIRVDNRNIFIAECKFWRGEKGFNEAIEQLLGYLSWRDSKCALLIFNRNKDSSAVRQKMHEVMIARSEYRKTASHVPDGDCRYVFVKSSDPGREIHISTMLFDIPAPLNMTPI